MNKKMVRKRNWNDNSGVSELVGTILILLMTVMLFSGIILWVWGLPTPQPISAMDIATDFNSIDQDMDDPPTWDVVYINLTHRGGDEILGSIAEFYLNVNNTIEILETKGISGEGAPYGLTGNDNDWNIGEVWQYTNYGIEYYHHVKLTLVDKYRSVVLWEKNIWGYEGARPPIFVDKWTDGNPNSPMRDPVQDNMTDIQTGGKIPFGIFAKVTDLDGDLNRNSVYVRFTFGPLEGNVYQMFDNGNRALCDSRKDYGVFSLCKDEFWPGSDWLDWAGGILILNATDNEDHETVTRLILDVYNFGDTIIGDGDDDGIPPDIWDYIGFVQIDLDDVFWTHVGEWPTHNSSAPPLAPYPSHYHPIYRINNKHVQKDYGGCKGMVWDIVMNNHGNRTVFLDAYSTIKWFEGTSSKWRFIIANDTTGYPHTGSPGQEGDIFGFEFDPDYVMDINLQSREKGSVQLDAKFGSTSIGGGDSCNDFGDAGSTGANNNPHTIFISLTGILGPLNRTIQDILGHYGYSDISKYNPKDHLNNSTEESLYGDEWKTKRYGQLIPFLSIWVFSQGGAGSDDNPSYPWPPPQPQWY